MGGRTPERKGRAMDRSGHVAGGPGPGSGAVGQVLRRGRRGGQRRGRSGWLRPGLLLLRVRCVLDPASGHPLSLGRRWARADHGGADLRAGVAGSACFVEEGVRQGRAVPSSHLVGGFRSRGGLPSRGPLLVLLLLRDDAGAVLLLDRHLGSRAAAARRHEVLHLHAGGRTADAGLYRRSLHYSRPADRRVHLRLS